MATTPWGDNEREALSEAAFDAVEGAVEAAALYGAPIEAEALVRELLADFPWPWGDAVIPGQVQRAERALRKAFATYGLID